MSVPNVSAWLGAAAIIAIILVARSLNLRKRKGPMPPGPAGWPILGNALDVPLDYSWHAFAKWAERWGESHHYPLFCARGPRALAFRALTRAGAIPRRVLTMRPQETSCPSCFSDNPWS